VHLVDEHDELAFALCYLLEDGLEPFLELTAELGSGDERTQIERQQSLVLEAFRHIAVGDALRESLGDRGLTNARLADQHRIVLGSAREHLDHATNLLVAPDHRIELAFARRIGEIAGVALQRLVLVLGRLVGDAMRPANVLEGLEQRVVSGTHAGEQGSALRSLDVGQSEKEMLGRHKLVAELLGVGFCLVKNLIDLARESRLRVGLLRVASHLAADHFAQLRYADAELLKNRHNDPLVLGEQGEQQVQIVHEGIARAAREIDGLVEGFGCLDGETVWIDHRLTGKWDVLGSRRCNRGAA